MLPEDEQRFRDLDTRVNAALREPDRFALSELEFKEWEALSAKRRIYREARQRAERAAQAEAKARASLRGLSRIRHALASKDG